MRQNLLATVFLTVGLLVPAVRGSSATTKPAPPDAAPKSAVGKPEIAPLVESATVDIVNVDVVVTDSKGKRVRGLVKEDFELLQDGRPQKLTNFYEVAGGSLVPDKAETAAAPTPVPGPEIDQPVLQRTWIVVYVDNLFLAPFDRNRAMRAVNEFLRRHLGPRSQAMIVTADRSSKIRHKFTDRLGELAEMLDTIEKESSFGQQREADRNRLFEDIEQSEAADRADSAARMWARDARADVDTSLDTLKSFLGSLAGLDGRKILLHVSGGMPGTPGRELFEAVQKKFQTSNVAILSGEFDRGAAYERVVDAANRVGVTIYALDASGLSLAGVGGAETGRPSAMADVLFTTRSNTQDPLRAMSSGTGGVALINRNDATEALVDLGGDLTDYYSLGFPAPAAGVEKLRKIEVSVKRKGLEVRTRRSYSEKGIYQRITEQVTSALYYPRTENPLGITITHGAPEGSSGAAFIVPFEVKVPIGKLTLVPQGDDEVARVHFYFAALDSDLQQSDVATATQEITVPAKEVESARKKVWVYETKLAMLPGSQRLSLAVRDEVSNQVSFVVGDLFVSALPGKKGAQEALRVPPVSGDGPKKK